MASSEERRHKERILVSSYRTLLNDLQTVQQDGLTGKELHHRLGAADSLYRRCEPHEPQVTEVDSELVAGLADELSRCVRGVGRGAFQPADFAARLVAAIGQAESPTPNAWAGLGRMTASLLAPCPGLGLMLGTVAAPNAPPPERRPREPRRKAAQLAAAVAPDQVVENADPGATPQQINRLESMLKAYYERLQRPIGFFEFAYHPTEFGVTVENVFHTSILVKMKKARVFLSNGLPVIEPIQAGSASGAASDERHQVLVKIDHDSWRQVVQHFGIRKALIPPADGAQRAQSSSER